MIGCMKGLRWLGEARLRISCTKLKVHLKAFTNQRFKGISKQSSKVLDTKKTLNEYPTVFDSTQRKGRLLASQTQSKVSSYSL